MREFMIRMQHTSRSTVVGVCRVMLGLLFLSSGVMKFAVPALRNAFSGQLTAAGLPLHAFNMWFVPLAEVVIGGMLLLGLFARLASLMGIGMMAVAIYVHLVVHDPALFPLQPQAPIIPAAAILLCLYVVWAGSGSFSMDLRQDSGRTLLSLTWLLIASGLVVSCQSGDLDLETLLARHGESEPPEASSPEGAAKLRRGAIGHLHGLHELQGLGQPLELLDRFEIDGVLYYPVKLTFDDGHAKHYYIDPESFLVTRQRNVHALHPDLDPTEIWTEGRNSDFRTVGGDIVRSFFSSEWNLDTGERAQSTELKRVDVKPVLDPAIFEMPVPEVAGG